LIKLPLSRDGAFLIIQEEMMIKIMALMFVIIAPTLAGISMVAVLSMSSPIVGGTQLSEQGGMILMVTIGAAIVALPISYFVAKMVSQTMGTQAGNS
jgi:hypothetical protein